MSQGKGFYQAMSEEEIARIVKAAGTQLIKACTVKTEDGNEGVAPELLISAIAGTLIAASNMIEMPPQKMAGMAIERIFAVTQDYIHRAAQREHDAFNTFGPKEPAKA